MRPGGVMLRGQVSLFAFNLGVPLFENWFILVHS
jgi:hypothetical protein